MQLLVEGVTSTMYTNNVQTYEYSIRLGYTIHIEIWVTVKLLYFGTDYNFY